MPQIDLETIVSVRGGGNNDRKIACETLADRADDDLPEDPNVADVPPDFPPESFWLSKDAEFDWFDRNAFLERKESTKGNSNSTNLSPTVNPHSNSNSQRFSMNLKSKAAIIGLPKRQKTNYNVDSKRRNCKQANIKLFPKRSESVGKSVMTEPSSPKVSCMGRVRSKRGRRRSSGPAPESRKQVEKLRSGSIPKTGFFSRLLSMFRSSCRPRDKPAVKTTEPTEEPSLPPRNSATIKAREFSDPVAEPPGLGSMARFSSGRRSESWSAEDIHVARCDSLDLERRVARQRMGPPEEEVDLRT